MGSGKKKIEIKKIEKESSRMTTFSKRRKGLFKKAGEFRSKTGSKVAILVISASGKPYPFGDIDAIDAILNPCLNSSNLSVQNGRITTYDDGSNYGVCSGSNLGLRQWLNEVNVDKCEDIEELLLLKKQLEEAKEMTGARLNLGRCNDFRSHTLICN